jgi:predicted dehydrogenase
MSVSLGIIGAGQIAHFHVEAIAACGACVAAIADPDENAGRRLAARAGARYFTDPRQLLEDSGIQAVTIATPNATHFALAMAALAAGKDVLCEKPMTTSAADSAELVRAAAERPECIFQVGYMKRFNPGFQLFRDLLPEIGEPIFAEVRVMAERRPATGESWYGQPAQSGGGILTHSGSHLLDVIRFLLGEPSRVDARVLYAHDVPGLDQSTQALLDLENGLSVHFSTVSTPAPLLGHTGEGWEETIEVIGDDGRLRLSSPNWQGTAPCLVTLQRRGEREARTFLPDRVSQWEAEMHDFLEAVTTRRPPSPNVVDGYRVDEVLAALYASGEQRSPVDIQWRV